MTSRNVPKTWKNSVYLEWYSQENGRVVLEASELVLSVSEAVWEMTEAEELAARESAAQALSDFLDDLCMIDREKEALEAEVSEDKPMDEFAWEKFLRHSDKLSDRYGELIDKFGSENEEAIAYYMNWDYDGDGEGEPEGQGFWDEDGLELEEWEDTENVQAPAASPAQGGAADSGNRWNFPATTWSPRSPNLWSAVATVSAKLAGALSSYECDAEPDAGFTIAQLKRCLVHIDTAVGEARQVSPSHVQPLLRHEAGGDPISRTSCAGLVRWCRGAGDRSP